MGEVKETRVESIYIKLSKMRVELSKKKLTKTGRNTHSNYSYFQLGDFLPAVNEIADAHKAMFLFVPGRPAENVDATLTLFNLENLEDKIVFNMPVAAINISGSTAMQNLGGITTYSKRYLYMDALEIAEDDMLDTDDTATKVEKEQREKKRVESEKKAEEEAAKAKLAPLTVSMIATINAELARTGVSEKAVCDRYHVKEVKELTVGVYKGLMNSLKQTPDKPLEG